MNKYHTVVIGGGCLGTASAIAIANHLKANKKSPESVCLIEKNVLSSALSIRHSGIVRAANADTNAAILAKISTDMWINIKNIWGVEIESERTGALWITKKDEHGTNTKWDKLANDLKSVPVKFKKISKDAAQKICPDFLSLHDNEVFYHEPDAFQLEPSHVRLALYQSIRASNATLFENEEVMGFKKNKSNKITEVILTNRVIKVDHVINAAGAWSPKLFKNIGVNVPVGVEPVLVANWLNSLPSEKKSMPIIADYTNRAYFRTWRDGEVHMHQPRNRWLDETRSLFADSHLDIIGADFVNNPVYQMQGLSKLHNYKDIANKRFNNLQNTVFSSGHQSYFDITPDLKFILGPDSKVTNLLHCLGSGQAFKYAPVFGEMMKQFIFEPGQLSDLGSSFLIKRFDANYMKNFLDRYSGINHTLNQDNNSL